MRWFLLASWFFLAAFLVFLYLDQAAGQNAAKVEFGSGAVTTKTPVAPDGTQVQLDLPTELHLQNKGGIDGAGLCVFTSLNHSAYWNNIPALWDFRDWMARTHAGGGWPEKVTQMIKELCGDKKVPEPEYIQVQSADLDILKLAVKTGRMPGVTYSYSPTGRYGGKRISHMVTLVHAGVGKGPDGKGWWAILDNNYPGTLEWMSESDFRQTYTGGGRAGWAVIFLNPGPPPVPAPWQ